MTTTSPIKHKQPTTTGTWLEACKVSDLVENSGVCVLLEGKQIALFSLKTRDANIHLYACDNFDPFGKANVLYRGILCSIQQEICICSPLYKQHFSLNDGHCLEDEAVSVGVYAVKVDQDKVFICMPSVATQ